MAYADPAELGDDFLTVAAANQFTNYHTLLDDERNIKLIREGRSAGMLAKGDRVWLPEEGKNQFKSAQVTRVNPYVIGRREAILRLRILHFGGQPADGVKGMLRYDLDGLATNTPVTVSGGLLEQKVDIRVKAATLTLRFPATDKRPEYEVKWDLKISHLEPLSPKPDKEPAVAARAAQARLNNLACNSGKVDGDIGDITHAALTDFQLWKKTPNPGGQLDAGTAGKLRESHEIKSDAGK